MDDELVENCYADVVAKIAELDKDDATGFVKGFKHDHRVAFAPDVRGHGDASRTAADNGHLFTRCRFDDGRRKETSLPFQIRHVPFDAPHRDGLIH